MIDDDSYGCLVDQHHKYSWKFGCTNLLKHVMCNVTKRVADSDRETGMRLNGGNTVMRHTFGFPLNRGEKWGTSA